MDDTSDRLTELRAEGLALGDLDEEQLAVLRDLNDDEIKVLVDVHRRLVENGPVVQAHSGATPMTIGGLFF